MWSSSSLTKSLIYSSSSRIMHWCMISEGVLDFPFNHSFMPALAYAFNSFCSRCFWFTDFVYGVVFVSAMLTGIACQAAALCVFDQQYFRIPDNIHCTNAKYQRVYMASFKLNIALWRYNHFFGILRRIPHKIIKSDRIRFLIHFDFWCCLKHCFILTLIIIYFMFEKCKMFLHSFYNFTLAIYFTFW